MFWCVSILISFWFICFRADLSSLCSICFLFGFLIDIFPGWSVRVDLSGLICPGWSVRVDLSFLCSIYFLFGYQNWSRPYMCCLITINWILKQTNRLPYKNLKISVPMLLLNKLWKNFDIQCSYTGWLIVS